MLRRFGLIFLLALLVSSCLPKGDETIVLSYIPAQFLKGWTLGIRCQGMSYDAIIIRFNINNLKYFKAEGEGEDYNGVMLVAEFEAQYNPKTDFFTAIINIYNSDKTTLFRSDMIELQWSEYDGAYVPMVLTRHSPETLVCPSEAIFSFSDELVETGLRFEGEGSVPLIELP